jgi:hypothetical protein
MKANQGMMETQIGYLASLMDVNHVRRENNQQKIEAEIKGIQ